MRSRALYVASDSPYQRPWRWGSEDAADHARHEVARMVGRTTSVRASPSVLTLVSERRTAYLLGDAPDVRRCAVALVEHGHQVYWLATSEALRTLHNEAAQLTVATDILPSTCQYVVPVQTYHYEGIRLLCVDQECWHHPDLHTRLFTYVCLLQRALPCAVFHTWNPWPSDSINC